MGIISKNIMLKYIFAHKQLFLILTGTSMVLFIGTLIALPILISKIPRDYFLREDLPKIKRDFHKNILHILLTFIKNLIGITFIILGIIMIFTPGQGLLSILLGIILTNFPYKRQLERKLIANIKIFNAINWIRKKQKVQPILMPKI